jgi:hypothetical protein
LRPTFSSVTAGVVNCDRAAVDSESAKFSTRM